MVKQALPVVVRVRQFKIGLGRFANELGSFHSNPSEHNNQCDPDCKQDEQPHDRDAGSPQQ